MFKRLSTFHITMVLIALALVALYYAGLVSGAEASLIGAAGLGGMILDERLEFADATSAILNVGNAILGDVIDLKSPTTDPNTTVDLFGACMWLVIQVDTTFVGVGATVQFQLCSDSTADLATSKTVHWDSGAIALATLVAGYRVCAICLPSGSYERYLGLWETVAVANVTAGKVNAFLTCDPALYRPYGDNVA
jgi:hypothetical protein